MLGSKDIEIASTLPKSSTHRWSERHWIYLLLIATDVIAVGMGVLIAYIVRFETEIPFFADSTGSVVDRYSQLAIVLIPAWLLIFAICQLYDSEVLFGGLQEYARVFNACTTVVMVIMVATFLLPELIIARGWLLLTWFTVTGLAGVGRFAMRRFVYRMRARGLFLTTILIVGADNEGKAIAEQLTCNSASGVRILGFIDEKLPRGIEAFPGVPILGSTDALRGLVRRLGVKELIISSSALSREKLLEIFYDFGTSDDVNVRLSSGLFEIMTTGLRVKDIGHVPLLSVNRVRLTGADVVLKTVLDYIGAALGLLILWPLLLFIAIAIKRDSPGPVFHRRRVMGVEGNKFNALKFRTMSVDADKVLVQNPELRAEFEENFKLREDPRVTSVGKLLRRLSLDELPQLINVLRGQMSLVGPRMIVEEEVAKYSKWGMNLLTVKPGITGLWQVSGRSDVAYEDRVRLDMHYIRNYTIWLDLQVLFQTIPAVLRKKGAY